MPERNLNVAISAEWIVTNKVGLHARPAANFVKTATSYRASISVENLSKGTRVVNAKSMLSVLSIQVQSQDRIRVTSEGDDERAAMAALAELIESHFGEEIKP